MPACASSGHSRMQRCGRQRAKSVGEMRLYEICKVMAQKRESGCGHGHHTQGDTHVFTVEEVAEHNTEDDAWVTAHGKVYDITKFMTHPGGRQALLRRAGADATEDFDFHKNKSGWSRYEIGTLAGAEDSACLIM